MTKQSSNVTEQKARSRSLLSSMSLMRTSVMTTVVLLFWLWQCGCKNHLRARYCNQCGHKLNEDRAVRDADGRAKLHADIAHPINSMCREKIQSAVLASYAEELERSKMPGYVSRYDDYEVDDFEAPYETHAPAAHAPVNEPPIRRGPLRGHTQHTRGNQSVLRGPHVPPRRDPSTEEVAEYHRRSEASGFGNGL